MGDHLSLTTLHLIVTEARSRSHRVDILFEKGVAQVIRIIENYLPRWVLSSWVDYQEISTNLHSWSDITLTPVFFKKAKISKVNIGKKTGEKFELTILSVDHQL